MLTYSLTPKTQPEKSYFDSVDELAVEVVVQVTAILQPIIDIIPAVCTEQVCLDLLLLGIYARRGLKADETPTLKHLDHTLNQLQESNDYAYQVQRLRLRQEFVMEQCKVNQALIWQLINRATNWFAERSNEILGVYTAQVNRFLASFDSINRSDTLFCTSPIPEYHINMVGAEILNKLWQKNFQETKHRLVVLPGCLRLDSNACIAEEWTLGFKCKRCSVNCQIKELSELGEYFGFHVSFVKHQSSLVSHVQDLGKLMENSQLGILGVACTLSLLEGGFMLESHKVPGQCVPLDFCGCKSHWHNEGLTTRVSIERVLDLVVQKS